MRNGFKGTGLNFVNVTGEATKLGDLVVSGYDAEEGYSEPDILINKVDMFGSELDGVFYTWYDFYNEESQEKWYGWYNEDGENCNSVELPIGEGVMVQTPGDWVKIQVSGQVYGSALPVQLRNGFTLVGNPVPSSLTLANITISGYDETEGYSEPDILINKLDMFGSELDGIFWTWYDFFNEESQEQWYGWYNEDGENCGTVGLELGEALMVQAPGDWAYINFPKAL